MLGLVFVHNTIGALRVNALVERLCYIDVFSNFTCSSTNFELFKLQKRGINGNRLSVEALLVIVQLGSCDGKKSQGIFKSLFSNRSSRHSQI